MQPSPKFLRLEMEFESPRMNSTIDQVAQVDARRHVDLIGDLTHFAAKGLGLWNSR